MTAVDLRNVTVQAIRLLLSGELRAREASALAQLCNSVYRVIQTADLETRVATLEGQVAQEESGAPPDRETRSHANASGAAGETDAQLGAEHQIPCPSDARTPAATRHGDAPRAMNQARPGRHSSWRPRKNREFYRFGGLKPYGLYKAPKPSEVVPRQRSVPTRTKEAQDQNQPDRQCSQQD